MAGRQRNDLSTPAVEKRPSADEQRGGLAGSLNTTVDPPTD